MLGEADSWPHQIEIEIARDGFDAKLRAIEAWLAEWQMPHRIGSSVGTIGRLRVCFAEEKFARACRLHHGGRMVSTDEIAAAVAADAEDEELYDRLAADYEE